MLNENIKAIRKSKGLSQQELAIKLNVVRQTVSKWEQGLSVPDSDMLISMSKILETPVSTLRAPFFFCLVFDVSFVRLHFDRSYCVILLSAICGLNLKKSIAIRICTFLIYLIFRSSISSRIMVVIS